MRRTMATSASSGRTGIAEIKRYLPGLEINEQDLSDCDPKTIRALFFRFVGTLLDVKKSNIEQAIVIKAEHIDNEVDLYCAGMYEILMRKLCNEVFKCCNNSKLSFPSLILPTPSKIFPMLKKLRSLIQIDRECKQISVQISEQNSIKEQQITSLRSEINQLNNELQIEQYINELQSSLQTKLDNAAMSDNAKQLAVRIEEISQERDSLFKQIDIIDQENKMLEGVLKERHERIERIKKTLSDSNREELNENIAFLEKRCEEIEVLSKSELHAYGRTKIDLSRLKQIENRLDTITIDWCRPLLKNLEILRVLKESLNKQHNVHMKNTTKLTELNLQRQEMSNNLCRHEERHRRLQKSCEISPEVILLQTEIENLDTKLLELRAEKESYVKQMDEFENECEIIKAESKSKYERTLLQVDLIRQITMSL